VRIRGAAEGDTVKPGYSRVTGYVDKTGEDDKEAPIMVRVDITRDELKQLKVVALMENKTSQALLGELVRARIAEVTS
jgi:hypothetical protein